MLIPVENIYYLLSYAWDKTEIAPGSQIVGNEAGDHVIDLLGSMLVSETRKLINQGLATSYLPQTRHIKGIKGKLLLSQTFQLNQAAVLGQTVCAIEELSPDVVPNQIIKATLLQLQQTVELALNLKKEMTMLLHGFTTVQTPVSGGKKWQQIRIPRHQQERYRFILNCCTFINQNLLPTENGLEFAFKAFLMDKKQMGSIFEAFVRNFYRREQFNYRVKSEKINWQGGGITNEAQNFLPVMLTDISLESAAQKIIIDTKFYKKALLPHYQNEKLHSKHLYQLFAYLQNLPVPEPSQTLEGMLLYPVVDKALHLEYILSGKKVRICTINLNQPWPAIKQDLLQLIA